MYVGNSSVVKIYIIRPNPGPVAGLPAGNQTRVIWIARPVVGNAFCGSVVEHWSSNPEDAGSIHSRKALELHFSQLVPVWVL